jgi:hypothetical protein
MSKDAQVRPGGKGGGLDTSRTMALWSTADHDPFAPVTGDTIAIGVLSVTVHMLALERWMTTGNRLRQRGDALRRSGVSDCAEDQDGGGDSDFKP